MQDLVVEPLPQLTDTEWVLRLFVSCRMEALVSCGYLERVQSPKPTFFAGDYLFRGTAKGTLIERTGLGFRVQGKNSTEVQLGDISYCKAAEPTHLRKDLVDEQDFGGFWVFRV